MRLVELFVDSYWLIRSDFTEETLSSTSPLSTRAEKVRKNISHKQGTKFTLPVSPGPDSLRADNTQGKGIVCATPLNIGYCMSQHLVSTTVSMAYCTLHLSIVYRRVLKIPRYSVVNVICLENKAKPAI